MIKVIKDASTEIRISDGIYRYFFQWGVDFSVEDICFTHSSPFGLPAIVLTSTEEIEWHLKDAFTKWAKSRKDRDHLVSSFNLLPIRRLIRALALAHVSNISAGDFVFEHIKKETVESLPDDFKVIYEVIDLVSGYQDHRSVKVPESLLALESPLIWWAYGMKGNAKTLESSKEATPEDIFQSFIDSFNTAKQESERLWSQGVGLIRTLTQALLKAADSNQINHHSLSTEIKEKLVAIDRKKSGDLFVEEVKLLELYTKRPHSFDLKLNQLKGKNDGHNTTRSVLRVATELEICSLFDSRNAFSKNVSTEGFGETANELIPTGLLNWSSFNSQDAEFPEVSGIASLTISKLKISDGNENILELPTNKEVHIAKSSDSLRSFVSQLQDNFKNSKFAFNPMALKGALKALANFQTVLSDGGN